MQLSSSNSNHIKNILMQNHFNVQNFDSVLKRLKKYLDFCITQIILHTISNKISSYYLLNI